MRGEHYALVKQQICHVKGPVIHPISHFNGPDKSVSYTMRSGFAVSRTYTRVTKKKNPFLPIMLLDLLIFLVSLLLFYLIIQTVSLLECLSEKKSLILVYGLLALVGPSPRDPQGVLNTARLNK